MNESRGENQIAAVFDFDGTLVRGDSFRSFLFYYLTKENFVSRAVFDIILAFLLRKMRLVTLSEAKMRCLRCFVGWSREQIEELGSEFEKSKLMSMVSHAARERIAWHRSCGHTTIVATSAPDIYFRNMKTNLDIDFVLATPLEFQNNLFTGMFQGGLDLFGLLKVQKVIELCESQGIDLKSSYAYTDHHSDISLLKNVCHPHVVSPTSRLKKIALQSGWPILSWH
jgi:HAD superfamily hydrolase (TIGR01490 family)